MQWWQAFQAFRADHHPLVEYALVAIVLCGFIFLVFELFLSGADARQRRDLMVYAAMLKDDTAFNALRIQIARMQAPVKQIKRALETLDQAEAIDNALIQSAMEGARQHRDARGRFISASMTVTQP